MFSIFEFLNEFLNALSVLFEEVVGDQVEDASALEYVLSHRVDELRPQDQKDQQLENHKDQEDYLHYRVEALDASRQSVVHDAYCFLYRLVEI